VLTILLYIGFTSKISKIYVMSFLEKTRNYFCN